MWILSILPDWVFHVMLAAGVAGTIAGFVLGMIPFIKTYIIPIRIISLLILSIALYLEGGIANNLIWQARVKEVEAKLATAEAKSQEVKVQIQEKIVYKTKVVKEKETVYIDRITEIAKEIDAKCEVDPRVVEQLNKASEDPFKGDAK
jgi:uncharacterized membrane protein